MRRDINFSSYAYTDFNNYDVVNGQGKGSLETTAIPDASKLVSECPPQTMPGVKSDGSASDPTQLAIRTRKAYDEKINNDVRSVVADSTRSKLNNNEDTAVSRMDCTVSLHPLASYDGMMVQIVPPKEPVEEDLDHVACDIVLVIDVSGSMGSLAPVPPSRMGDTKTEQTGITVLDLTKHAANTIIETLGASDRLGIVTFSEECEVLLELIPMTTGNKREARHKIKSMQHGSSTAMWNGIQLGLQQFRNNADRPLGNIQTMMLLTDGIPLGVGSEPSNGWVPAMKNLGRLPATIHTYGFGYDLEPGLLQTIAELGDGNYCFIPDSSMLGTAFIHTVANLQSTFARNAVLTLECPYGLELMEVGPFSDEGKPPSSKSEAQSPRETQVRINNLQYGQSREVCLRYKRSPNSISQCGADHSVQATLEYEHGCHLFTVTADGSPGIAPLSPFQISYHVSRAYVVRFLSQLFHFNRIDGYKPIKEHLLPKPGAIEELLMNLPANSVDYREGQWNSDLIQDLIGNNAKDGQIEMALRTSGNGNYWEKWGRHYLPSLINAHARQIRLSFNDPGTQHYGAASPLFLKRLEVLNETFDKLPPPCPSRIPNKYSHASSSNYQPTKMSAYNNPSGGCFAGETRVLLTSTSDCGYSKRDKDTIAIQDLRPGMMVQTLRDIRKVRTVVKLHTDQTHGRPICVLPTGTSITPWHPISLDDGETWVFPAEAFSNNFHPSTAHATFREPVYTVQLQRLADADHPDAHTINVDGLWAVTLGHGLIDPATSAQAEDIRNHSFFGNYDAVAASLDALPTDIDGVTSCSGITRNVQTGFMEGFAAFCGEE